MPGVVHNKFSHRQIAHEKSSKNIFATAVGLVFVAGLLIYSCRGIDSPLELDRKPANSLALNVNEGEIVSFECRATGVAVRLLAHRYSGDKTGFWGAHSTPPHSVLSAIQLIHNDVVFYLPEQFVSDLSNVLQCGTVKRSDAFAASPSNACLITDMSTDRVVFSVNGGDGHGRYTAVFRVRLEPSVALVSRSIEEHSGD